MKSRSGPPKRHLASSPFKPPPEPVIKQFTVDHRVSHDRYGVGRVVSVEADAVTVDFGRQTVRIVSPFNGMEEL
jgi:hypothetical protein